MTVTIKHSAYNKNLHNSAKKLNAKFCDGSWHFDDVVADKAQKLKEKWEGELVAVEITAKNKISTWKGPVYFAGYKICEAFGRDSGAKIASQVFMMNGKIGSGGSCANWTTTVDDGSTFRLKILKSMLEKAKQSNNFDVKLAEESIHEADVEIEDEYEID